MAPMTLTILTHMNGKQKLNKKKQKIENLSDLVQIFL